MPRLKSTLTCQLQALLREEMGKQGLGQQDLAVKLGVTKAAVNNWLSPHRNPKLTTLEQMFASLGLRVIPQVTKM